MKPILTHGKTQALRRARNACGVRCGAAIRTAVTAIVLCAGCPASARAQAIVLETADGSANLVGEYTSLALDAAGDPHVSYLDATTTDLKYARKSGGIWIRETADVSASYVGRFTSLALDAAGNVHVGYNDATANNVKYARKSGGVWTIETADGSANDVGQHTSLALDASGNPHMSYFDFTIGDLKYARKSAGVWTIETADGSANVSGQYSSLAIDAAGNPHVSYWDQTSTDLKYARKSAGVWTRETADGSANDVGRFISLALDAAGNPHVSYQDWTTDDVKYARKLEGVWTRETADGSANMVGDYLSLALDAAGNPHLTYYDESTDDLKYAYIPSVVIASPQPSATWAVGSEQTIRWSFTGGLPVDNSDVYLSVDGGNSFTQLRNEARDPAMTLRVPHTPTRFGSIKIIRPSPYAEAYMDSFFTIDATITLIKFEAIAQSAREGRGSGKGRPASAHTVALAWETRPGREAGIRYRVERATNGAASHVFVPLTVGPLDANDYLDAEAGAVSAPTGDTRYRLIAINGLGAEYTLGETAVTGAPASRRDLSVQPNPARGGSTTFLFRAPFDATSGGVASSRVEVAIFDVAGRKVATLVDGPQSSGTHAVSWDGREGTGREVAAGVYFARLSWGGVPRVTERVTVVR